MKKRNIGGKVEDRECHPTCAHKERFCPRCQAYERLPKLKSLQALITFVMGTPHEGQQSILNQTRASRLIIVFGIFFGAVAASCVTTTLLLMNRSPARFVLLPLLVSTILTTSGIVRSMSMYVLHYASHGAFGRQSNLIGHVASSLAFLLSLNDYSFKHLREHHPFLAGKKDPDQQAIIALGFIPGMPLDYYQRQLLKVLMSPRLFMLYLRGRVSSQFAKTQPLRLKALTTALHALPLMSIAYVGYASGSFVPVLVWTVAWLLPLTYGSYVSMVLFSLALHRWFLQREPGMNEHDFYYAKTFARFFGDPVPSSELPLLKRYRVWGFWWLRFFLLHLLIGKLFIMGFSDSQHHDAHHTDPQGREYQWWNNIQSRHHLTTAGRDAAKMRHTWGSPFKDIRLNFKRISQTPSLNLAEFMQGANNEKGFLNYM